MVKSINYSINALKFIAIFSVICIHCININEMEEKFEILLGLMRFAVPIFFLISGFYSYYEDSEKALQKYKKKNYQTINIDNRRKHILYDHKPTIL